MNSFKDDAAKNRMLDIMKDKSYVFCISKDSDFLTFGSPIEAVFSSQHISVTDDGKIRILCFGKYEWEPSEKIVKKDDRRMQHIEIDWRKKDLNKKK